MSILADFYTPEIITDPKFKLSPSGVYYAPPKGKYDDYVEFIKVSERLVILLQFLIKLYNQCWSLSTNKNIAALNIYGFILTHLKML